ncbi:hypothetical protein QO001_005039 [Methylobacterium brachiatum]|uniref:Uncharacterized protein n=1 Tax=Methylobacterium brachiatum TaxID=269660 RepID=A0AAJ1WZ80_9HYPH|nr:hypothetical protein [Methylobacterium brachiatum]MCB4805164.1 hypothetical protein [Methylobacterium brachiatum]MDQ0546090.1 hypothetical protein [Methylobacterium brachiatum]
MPREADHPDHGEELCRLLCDALDGAGTDPTRVALMTKLFMLDADDDRDADLARLRQSGPLDVLYKS